MTKTLIDVDDELLATAQLLLGTGTKKATVNRALAEVVASHERLKAYDRLTSIEALADAAAPGFKDEAWGR